MALRPLVRKAGFISNASIGHCSLLSIPPHRVASFHSSQIQRQRFPVGNDDESGSNKKNMAMSEVRRREEESILDLEGEQVVAREPVYFDKYVSPKVSAYLRLARVDKPVGTWLLLFPCLWSVALAASPGALPSLSLFTLYGVGAFVMRGAGCTINDLWDRDIDKKVARTTTRPITSGEVSVKEAIGFLGAQLLTGLGTLVCFNAQTIQLGIASLPLVIAYPLAKRFTQWPQLVLGLTFNWGALVGFTSVMGYTDWSVVLPLYAAGVSWTIVYDTVYAHQDKVDDKKLGLGSTALRFGERTKPILSAFSALTMTGIALSGYMADLGLPFYTLAVAGGSAHLAWQLATVNLDNPRDCMSKFISNKWFAALILAGIILDKLLQEPDRVVEDGSWRLKGV